jgi:hypothetical protein
MPPLNSIDTFDIFERRDRGRHRGPAALCATRFYGGSASSQANPNTLTTSGASSPITSGNGSSATSGSIALGAGSKYQESGSIDLSGASLETVGGNVSASNGSTVTVGDPGLDQAISQVITSLTSGGSIPVSLANGSALGETVVSSAPQPSTSSSFLDSINWTLVVIIGILAAGAVGVFLFLGAERR